MGAEEKTMHEATLAGNLLRIAQGALSGHEGARVRRVNVQVGALSGVMPDALRFAFDALKRGTPFEAAELTLGEAPIRLLCCDCEGEYEPAAFPWTCPACESARFRIVGGEDTILQSLEMDG